MYGRENVSGHESEHPGVCYAGGHQSYRGCQRGICHPGGGEGVWEVIEISSLILQRK